MSPTIGSEVAVFGRVFGLGLASWEATATGAGAGFAAGTGAWEASDAAGLGFGAGFELGAGASV